MIGLSLPGQSRIISLFSDLRLNYVYKVFSSHNMTSHSYLVLTTLGDIMLPTAAGEKFQKFLM